MMLGYDIRMEGKIKALFLHQAAPAGAAFFLFLVANIAVLLFAFIGLIIWDLEIPSRGDEGNLHAHTHSHIHRHNCLVCSLLSVSLQRCFTFIVYKPVFFFEIKFLLLCNQGQISQKNLVIVLCTSTFSIPQTCSRTIFILLKGDFLTLLPLVFIVLSCLKGSDYFIVT